MDFVDDSRGAFASSPRCGSPGWSGPWNAGPTDSGAPASPSTVSYVTDEAGFLADTAVAGPSPWCLEDAMRAAAEPPPPPSSTSTWTHPAVSMSPCSPAGARWDTPSSNDGADGGGGGGGMESKAEPAQWAAIPELNLLSSTTRPAVDPPHGGLLGAAASRTLLPTNLFDAAFSTTPTASAPALSNEGGGLKDVDAIPRSRSPPVTPAAAASSMPAAGTVGDVAAPCSPVTPLRQPPQPVESGNPPGLPHLPFASPSPAIPATASTTSTAVTPARAPKAAPAATCGQCGRHFTTTSSLNRHVSRVHYNHRPHTCGDCGAPFGQRGSLTRHAAAVHGGGRRAYGCGVCGRRFGRKDNLGVHIATVHRRAGGAGTTATTPTKSPRRVGGGVDKRPRRAPFGGHALHAGEPSPMPCPPSTSSPPPPRPPQASAAPPSSDLPPTPLPPSSASEVDDAVRLLVRLPAAALPPPPDVPLDALGLCLVSGDVPGFLG